MQVWLQGGCRAGMQEILHPEYWDGKLGVGGGGDLSEGFGEDHCWP
jgi:hypothetical protein